MASRSFVLIPGAGGSAWFWHRVDAELSGRGHDVVSVELPGSDDAAGLKQYVEITVAAAGKLADPTSLIVVGQSLGGFTAAAVTSRLSVAMLVYVNAMIPAPGETAGDWWGHTGQGQAKAALDVREGRDPAADFDVTVYFLHDVPDEVLAGSTGPPPDESPAIFSSPSMLFEQPDIETHVVVGRDDRFFPADFQRRVALQRLGIAADECPGGHLLALSHPVELADLLESYLGA